MTPKPLGLSKAIHFRTIDINQVDPACLDLLVSRVKPCKLRLSGSVGPRTAP